MERPHRCKAGEEVKPSLLAFLPFVPFASSLRDLCVKSFSFLNEDKKTKMKNLTQSTQSTHKGHEGRSKKLF
jgi:hypothetical protein